MMGNWGNWGNGANCGGLGFLGGGYGTTGMILSLVINLVVIIGVVLLIVWFVRRVFPARAMAGAAGGSAKDILQARYAHGEITREQYQKMLSDLS